MHLTDEYERMLDRWQDTITREAREAETWGGLSGALVNADQGPLFFQGSGDPPPAVVMLHPCHPFELFHLLFKRQVVQLSKCPHLTFCYKPRQTVGQPAIPSKQPNTRPNATVSMYLPRLVLHLCSRGLLLSRLGRFTPLYARLGIQFST